MKKLLERINEAGGEAEFSNKIPIRFIHSDYEYESTEAYLFYNIDVAYSGQGISNINFSFTRNIDVEVESFEIRSGNSRGMKKFSLDLSAAAIEWKAGNAYRPEEIEVYLNPDESVSRIIINCSFINKE